MKTKGWIAQNKATAISAALIPIFVVSGILCSVFERSLIRPYTDARADTVFVRKHAPCEQAVLCRLQSLEQREYRSRELLVKVYYYQMAMLTPDQEKDARDNMAKDSTFKNFLEGK